MHYWRNRAAIATPIRVHARATAELPLSAAATSRQRPAGWRRRTLLYTCAVLLVALFGDLGAVRALGTPALHVDGVGAAPDFRLDLVEHLLALPGLLDLHHGAIPVPFLDDLRIVEARVVQALDFGLRCLERLIGAGNDGGAIDGSGACARKRGVSKFTVARTRAARS